MANDFRTEFFERAQLRRNELLDEIDEFKAAVKNGTLGDFSELGFLSKLLTILVKEEEKTGTYRVWIKYKDPSPDDEAGYTKIRMADARGTYAKCEEYVERLKPMLFGNLAYDDIQIRKES